MPKGDEMRDYRTKFETTEKVRLVKICDHNEEAINKVLNEAKTKDLRPVRLIHHNFKVVIYFSN